MRLHEFVERHIKTRVCFDGSLMGADCVDLFRRYCVDVLGIPHTGDVAAAKDLVERYQWLSREREALALIRDTRGGARGDVAVWGASAERPLGHAGIVLTALGSSVLVFEQDAQGKGLASLAERSVDGIIGYLRKYPEGM